MKFVHRPSCVTRRAALVFLIAGGLGAPAAASPLPVIEVFKNPYCGCCTAWIEHVKAAGFPVKVTMSTDGPGVRKKLGIPESLASCHTATVAGYALEGHVPASDIKRLLATKPSALGLAVPGMPAGSPGMEAGGRVDRYEVLLVSKSGEHRTFSTYPAS